MSRNDTDRRVRLIVLDWAGTAVDFGCFAPVRPFVEAMSRVGVRLSEAQARGPMGLAKRDHLEALFRLPEAGAQWLHGHGRAWTLEDVDRVYAEHFIPLQLASVESCSGLVPGLLEAIAHVRQRGVRIGTTTGYFQEAAELAAAVALGQGYDPDHNVCPADVLAGRPAPWMIYRNMEVLNVYPPAGVVKVGDTLFDIEEGLNAGVWTVGVIDSSSEIGLTQEQFTSLPEAERRQRTQAWAARLREAGAHDVINTVADLPAALDRIELRLRQGDRP